MTGAVNNVAASSIAGAPQQSRSVSKENKKADEADARRKAIRDEFKKSVDEALAADAVRSAKDPSQEESREDHEEHDVGYHKHDGDGEQKRLDLSA
ncbi:MAG: hypothetical protein R3B57_14540 [Phycisphaerales bacterium]